LSFAKEPALHAAGMCAACQLLTILLCTSLMSARCLLLDLMI
jgi:hypothetical protein